MPTDKAGRFHMNHQRAMSADRHAPSHQAAQAEDPHHKVYDHGDGSYHTESPDGQRADHGNMQDLMGHLQSAMGGGHQMQPTDSVPAQSAPPMHAGKSLHGM